MPKVRKVVLNRVEGEIQLKLVWEKGKVKDAFIIAPNFRGFEFILEGKPALDAMVINPRICGICGHAHLIATTKAIENLYENAGHKIDIPQNAKLIRDITLGAEIIQNHLRWFYMFVMPDFIKLEKSKKLKDFEPIKGYKWQKAVDFSSRIVKVIAIFGGQWPHTSYSVPGGVVCDPTTFDLTEAKSIVDSVVGFAQQEIFGMDIEDYLSVSSEEEYLKKSKNSDLKKFIFMCKKHQLDHAGKSYHRFLTVCDMEYAFSKGITKKKRRNFYVEKVREIDSYSYLTENGFSFDKNRYSWAKAVRYDGLPYETSPLSRRINSREKLFINLLKHYRDSYMVRMWARIDEIARMLYAMKMWIESIKPSEPFYIPPPADIKEISGEGVGLCEAARGSLIHQLTAEKGIIKKYNIITPSTWNLGPRCEKYPSPAEKAIKGADSQIKAEMILRSFDVCSVCTTH